MGSSGRAQGSVFFVLSINLRGHMDKKIQNNWAWVSSVMPNIAVMVKEKRILYGDAHVDECWRRGVVLGEPGWFFAREGAVAIGTPDQLCDGMHLISRQIGFPQAPLLMMMESKEHGNGTH
jgi:hypothetical protein